MSVARMMQMAAAGVPAGGGDVWTDPDLSNASYDSVSLAISGTNFTDVFFKPDGTMFFAADNAGIDSYNLATAWDLTSSSASSSFSTNGAFNVYFKPDGSRVFWVNNTSDSLSQADLSTAWDISTVGTPEAGAPVVGTIVRGIRFSLDGTKMYAADRPNTLIKQFDLSIAWDISSSSASSSPSETFNVGSQASEPAIYAFNPDGTKMWITDAGSDTIYEYSLSTAWSVSSGSYSSISFSLSSQDATPIGGQFKSDGSKMYVVGTTTDTIYQYSTAAAAPAEWTDPDLANASYDSVSFSVAAQDTSPLSLFFSPDGLKMYILGNVGDDVNEYDLSTAWDVSTATYLKNFSVAAQDTTPISLFFSPDGTKMYVLGFAGDDVNEYDLSTAWDVSTATYLQNFSVAAQDTSPLSLFFSPDGLKMYILGNVGGDVNEYDLSTAWDVSTATYLQNFSVAAQDTSLLGLFLSPDGTQMFLSGNTNDKIYEYNLSAPWDVSTASFSEDFSVVTQDSVPYEIFFKSDGSKMYVLGLGTDTIYQYSTA